MRLVDVNVLVYAHRRDSPDHPRYKRWLEAMINSKEAYAISELVLSGFVRVVTHPRVFQLPTTLPEALAFCQQIREPANAIVIGPGPRHWDIFTGLCEAAGARGNLIPDAYLAAIAIESGSDWISTDRDFSRFNGLRWSHPLDIN